MGDTCACGCGIIVSLTNAQEPCTCGCDCCGQVPETAEKELEQLLVLRQAIEVRLAELQPAVAHR
ncbi:MAG TPA: hypothetical protein VM263_05800 [Acidimicrobiales bacterium]|nr:hypothetical protein [Acidimicrobiales bacterium]